MRIFSILLLVSLYFVCVCQKHEENGRSRENIPNTRRKKPRNESTQFCSNDGFYLTDRGGEADDENSQHGERVTRKHDLDEKPQRENPLCEECSNDSEVFDYYNDTYMEPNLNSRFKYFSLELLDLYVAKLPYKFLFLLSRYVYQFQNRKGFSNSFLSYRSFAFFI